MKKNILAIDPGKKKCGIAIVDYQKSFIAGEVVDLEELVNKLLKFINRYDIEEIVVGSGTNFESIYIAVQSEFPDIKLTKVVEKNTTMLARRVYFEFNPPRGILKFIPLAMQIPPEPYDDYAAYVIALRFLGENQ